MPAHFEQASELVTEDDVAKKIVCGPDPQRHIELVQKYVDAGYDEVYVAQVGNDTQGFLDFYRRQVVPRFA
jgi:hypothetical protein